MYDPTSDDGDFTPLTEQEEKELGKCIAIVGTIGLAILGAIFFMLWK